MSADFNLSSIVQIQIPINGKMEYVKRIRSYKNPNQILWQVYECDITYDDNIPVKLSYDINPSKTYQYYELNEHDLYLVPVGTVKRNDNILSQFSNISYARTPIVINWTKTNSLELFFKIKTGDNVNTKQNIFGMSYFHHVALEIINGKLRWELNSTYGSTKLLPNTIYFIKFVKEADKIFVYLSQDGSNFKLEITRTILQTVTNQYLYIGIDMTSNGCNPFKGTIYLNQSHIIYDNIKYHLKTTNNELVLIRDGSINVKNQIISGFSISPVAYAHTPIFINWTNTNETIIGLKIKTGEDINTRQELFGMQSTDNFELEILNKKIHWELVGAYSNKTLEKNTEYFIEFKKDAKAYTINIYTYSNDNNDKEKKLIKELYDTFSVTSNRTCTNQYLYLGVDKETNVEPFDGTIDLTESYLFYDNIYYKLRI